jgi:hypothetical protein
MVDEVTTLDNGSWMSIIAYVMVNFERLHLLIGFKHVQDRATTTHLK